MSRGRKPKLKDNGLNWQQFFNKNVGSYLQIISNELSSTITKQEETPTELLKKIEKEKEQLLLDRKLRLNNANPKSQIVELRYEIPNNWNWFFLSDIAFYQEGPGIRTFQYRNEGIKLLNVQNITQDKLRLDLTTRHIAVDEYEQKYKHFKVQEGDILFASSGGSWGKTCWFENFDNDLILNTSTMRIRTFSEKVLLNKYLYLFLKTDFFRNQLIPQLMGMQPNFGSTHFNSVSIPVPPISEQSKILDFLNDFENNNLKKYGYYFNNEVEQKIINLHKSQLTGSDISNELTQQLTLVKKLRQQLLLDAVQGKLVEQNPKDEPASELLKKIKAEKVYVVKEKKIKKDKEILPIKPEEIPFKIPENWVWCRLGEICTKIGSGSTPNGSNYSIQGKSFFRSQNIHDSGLVYDDIKFISDEIHRQMKGTTVYANDILLNITGGSLGRCALVPNEFEEGNVSQHVCIIRPFSVDNTFIHKTILSPFFQSLIFNSTTGAGREGLPKYNLEQFVFPLPPLSEQNRIVQKLEQLLLTCDALETEIRNQKSSIERLLQQVLREALEPKKQD